MKEIKMYMSDNGNTYATKKEAEEADKAFKHESDKVKFLYTLEAAVSTFFSDTQWKDTGIELPEGKLYIRKKVYKGKKDRFIIGTDYQDGNHGTVLTGGPSTNLVNSTYCEEQLGFCDDLYRDYLEDYFFDNQQAWFDAIKYIIDNEIAKKEAELKTYKEKAAKYKDYINEINK